MKTIDVKPKNDSVLNTKSITQKAIDIKSKMEKAINETVVYIDTRSIPKGQWIPLAGFTYPTALTFNATRI